MPPFGGLRYATARELREDRPQGPGGPTGRVVRTRPAPVRRSRQRHRAKPQPSRTTSRHDEPMDSRSKRGTRTLVKLTGRVEHRSGGRTTSGDAPSESTILDLNPERRRRLTELTGWVRLFRGTLNLTGVAIAETLRLDESEEAPSEDPADVLYPEDWGHIPELRGGWRYWEADAFKAPGSNARVEVLARRARRPHRPDSVELFAPCELRKRLGLRDGDGVHIEAHVGRRPRSESPHGPAPPPAGPQ